MGTVGGQAAENGRFEGRELGMGEKRRTDYTMGEVMEICKRHVETCAKCPFWSRKDERCAVNCYPERWNLPPAPAILDGERQLLKCLEGVKYVSRDGASCQFSRNIYLWAQKPVEFNTGLFADIETGHSIGHLPAELLPSIGPGECWSVEELL